MKGYTTCEQCQRPVVTGLLAAHQRKHAGTDWVSERVPVRRARPGRGSRSRRDRTRGIGGEGSPQVMWKRPRGAGPYN